MSVSRTHNMIPYRIRQAKCIEKTNRGNVFERRYDAKRAAANMRSQGSGNVTHFRCSCCGKYHIGGSGTYEQRLARNRRWQSTKRLSMAVLFLLSTSKRVYRVKIRGRIEFVSPVTRKLLTSCFVTVNSTRLSSRAGRDASSPAGISREPISGDSSRAI